MTYESESSSADAPQSAGRVRRDWTQSGRPSTTIVEAVAAATDRDPTDLTPLQHSVDADALDALLTENRSDLVTVSFGHDGVGVTVHSDGEVEVTVDGEPR